MTLAVLLRTFPPLDSMLMDVDQVGLGKVLRAAWKEVAVLEGILPKAA